MRSAVQIQTEVPGGGGAGHERWRENRRKAIQKGRGAVREPKRRGRAVTDDRQRESGAAGLSSGHKRPGIPFGNLKLESGHFGKQVTDLKPGTARVR